MAIEPINESAPYLRRIRSKKAQDSFAVDVLPFGHNNRE
jgi:hypothetical protein